MSSLSRITLVVLLLATPAACRRPDPSFTKRISPAPSLAEKSNDLQPPAADPGFLGLIIAPETVDVTSELDGRVVALHVRAGDRVARGDVLAELDTRLARHAAAVATAELALAKTEREQAKLELAQATERTARRQAVVQLPNRTVRTVSDEELSASRYQQRIAGVKLAAAEANVASKTAHLGELQTQLAEGSVRAPFDGVVTARYADVGTSIHQGTPILRLIESGDLRVRFAIPEEQASSVAHGDSVRIDTEKLALAGVIEKVNPEIETASRMVFAEASIDVPEELRGRVRSGQVARVHDVARAKELHVARAQ